MLIMQAFMEAYVTFRVGSADHLVGFHALC